MLENIPGHTIVFSHQHITPGMVYVEDTGELWQIPKELESLIEERWRVHTERAHRRGTRVWNGDMYTLRDVQLKNNQLHLRVGRSDYRVNLGISANPDARYIIENSNINPPNHMGIAAHIITDDNHIVFAEAVKTIKEQSPEVVSLIAGTYNEDECKIASEENIFAQVFLELEEETGVARRDVSDIYLDSLFRYHTSFFMFIFVVRLYLSASELERRFLQNKDEENNVLISIPNSIEDIQKFYKQHQETMLDGTKIWLSLNV